MTFDSDKRTFLAKQDKSVKGSIDHQIKKLCSRINKKQDFYTTSSCAGRIVLISIPESGKKHESEWLFVSHDLTQPDDIKEKLRTIPDDAVWLRYEPFIIHVACRTAEDAAKLLKTLHELGVKRSGIISLSSKIVVEIIGTEHIEALISEKGRMLVSDDYIAALVHSANQKLERNWGQIDRIVGNMTKLEHD